MKIAIVSTYFPPVAGGEGINAYHIARELAKKHDVHVFTSDRRYGKILKKEEIVDGVKVHRLKTWFRFGFHFVFYPSLKKSLLKENFDVVHFHSFGILQHDFAFLSKRKKHPSTIFIISPHHPSFSFEYSLGKKIITYIVKKFEKKYVIKRYDKVLEDTPKQYKWLKEWGVKKRQIEFFPVGINEFEFEKDFDNNLINKYGLRDKFIISYIGRIQGYKGLDQVIKVIHGLKKVNDKIIFLCMGKDAGFESKLKILVKNLNLEKNVFFIGRVTEREKRVFLRASKIFVLPSKIEGFGIVLLEAMAQKVPIISTKTEGGKFLIKEGKNGFLYEFGNLKKLRGLLEKLIKSKKLREKLGVNGNKFSKRFLWPEIINNLEKIYLNAKNDKKV